MSTSIHFVQECPTCGRMLQVRVQYLGKQVACRHCGGKFVAYDPDSGTAQGASISGLGLIARANELLETAKRHTAGDQSEFN